MSFRLALVDVLGFADDPKHSEGNVVPAVRASRSFNPAQGRLQMYPKSL